MCVFFVCLASDLLCVCVCVREMCVPGTAVQLSSSAAIQVFAFVFLHNRRRWSSVRSVEAATAAAAVSADRAYIGKPSTPPPSSGRRELGWLRLPVLLDDGEVVFAEPVAVDD